MPESKPPAAQLPDPPAVARSLRRLARMPQPAWLHAEVARRMAERLGLIRLRPEVLLDWWAQLGASGALLKRTYPKARRVCVEPDTILAEQRRAATARRWFDPRHWRAGSAEAIAEQDVPAAAADLLWSNMMLHAVANPPELIERWLRALRVDGFVMFSCLGPGSLRELRALYRQLGWGAPGHAFVDMHDLGDMLVHAGFSDPVMDQEVLELRWNDVDALRLELRTLGGNAATDRCRGLRTPAWRVRQTQALDGLRGADGKIGLSFEIVFGHAFKVAPRARVGAETVIALDDLRGMIGRR